MTKAVSKGAVTGRPDPVVGASDGMKPGSRRPGFVFYLVTLVAFCILLLLGNWQVQRLEWKEGLVATIGSRMQQAPVTLADARANWDETGDVDYLPVQFNGAFVNDREQFYLATHEGRSGWYVYTPMRLADGGMLIVNRGFIAYDQRDVSRRTWQPMDGTVEVVGLARNRLDKKPGWVVPENTPQEQTWYWKDIDAMASAMGLDENLLVPFFVDVSTTNGSTIAGPVGNVTRVVLPNNHLQYAVTWFGLALALLAVAMFFVWRAFRPQD
ncbi:MAG: SURF1 family protein [Rhizobiaceae bacterium]|nr:SURF1 family protein [Rhizobiaceae bacterium]